MKGINSMALVIRPIGEAFSGEVSDVDCRRPLSPEAVSAIDAGMDRFGVLVIRDQVLSDEEQLDFTLQFGEIEKKGRGSGKGNIHFRTGTQARPLAAGIGDFSNVDSAGKPLPADTRAYQFKLADRLWHSDSSFRPIPAKYSLLSGRAVPSWGGATEFADMRAAYEALDDRTKQEVEDLVCHHSQIYSREIVGFGEMTEAEREGFKPVRQRLVREHPVTGRKSLFLSSHAGLIEGWTIPESRMFLRDLIEFATQPRFVYAHSWRLHDLVIWDNRVTMHRGRRFDPNEARDVRQTRLAGDVMTIEQVD
jgi:alpha-ketoglutarate-dependent 2,4-dichlorophenoxyacetate dioxygenase